MTIMEDTTAEQMLRDIQSESLQQLLTSIQQRTKPPGPTGIPSFDSYLSTLAGEPNGSALCRSSLRSGDVIQIQGHPGSGKTHLLYFLVATCIMPMDYLSHSIGGWARAAFIMDTNGHFRISRLHDILLDRLQVLLPSQYVAPIIERCLERVHIFRPNSSEQLSATLTQLPKYHAKNLPEMDLGIVAIHSIDSFYWLDRFRAEQLRSTSLLGAVSRNIFSILENLRSRHGFIIVLIRSGFVQQFQNNSGLNWDQRAITFPANTPNVASHQSGISTTSQILFTPLLSDNRPQSAVQQWTVQLDDNPQPCVITCEIRDRGVTLD